MTAAGMPIVCFEEHEAMIRCKAGATAIEALLYRCDELCQPGGCEQRRWSRDVQARDETARLLRRKVLNVCNNAMQIWRQVLVG